MCSCMRASGNHLFLIYPHGLHVRHPAMPPSRGLALRVVFPLRGPGKPPGWKSPNNGENCKIPLPGPTPKIGENCPPKRGKNYSQSTLLCKFSSIFPNFGGRTGEGNFVIFPHFAGISALESSHAFLRGKTSRKASHKTFVHGPLYAGPQISFHFMHALGCESFVGFLCRCKETGRSLCTTPTTTAPELPFQNPRIRWVLSGPDPLRFLRVALRIEISTRCVFCVAGRIFIGFCPYQT